MTRDRSGRWAVEEEPPWSRESVLEAVLGFFEARGYQPVSREASAAYGLPSYDVVERLFRSWNEMIREAGFDPYPARSSMLAKKLARRDRAAP